jgi:cobalt-zinc-cadmium efflux system protein
MGHEHAHTAAGQSERRLALVCTLTFAYLVVEIVAGLLTGSLALLADAGHMFTDVAGLVLALFAIRITKRPATPERTYGYYRIEILAAVVNSVLLIGISLYILYEAYERFRDPPEVASVPMLFVAVVGLGVNIVGLFLLRSGASESLNVKGAYFEVLSDMLTSVGAILAAAVMWATGWYYADPLVSAGIGLFILPRTWALLREAVGILLEGTPSDVNLAALREAIGRLDGVTGVHDLHVWTLTSGMYAMSVHVVRADGASHDTVLERVRACATSSFEIAHATVQVESEGCAENETHL